MQLLLRFNTLTKFGYNYDTLRLFFSLKAFLVYRAKAKNASKHIILALIVNYSSYVRKEKKVGKMLFMLFVCKSFSSDDQDDYIILIVGLS
jgi:hypothetical protein